MASALLDDLCSSAEGSAQARGHDLGPWNAPLGETAIARATTCLRCGRAAYVRAEPPLAGAAGPALSESCDGPLEPEAG